MKTSSTVGKGEGATEAAEKGILLKPPWNYGPKRGLVPRLGKLKVPWSPASGIFDISARGTCFHFSGPALPECRVLRKTQHSRQRWL